MLRCFFKINSPFRHLSSNKRERKRQVVAAEVGWLAQGGAQGDAEAHKQATATP